MDKAYRITVIPMTPASGLGRKSIILENKGVSESIVGGRTLISTLIAISII